MIKSISRYKAKIAADYIGISAGFTTGILSVYTLPLLVTEAMDKYDIGPSEAGLFAASAAVGRGLAAAIISSRSRSLDLRRVALIGAVIIVIANLGLVPASSFAVVLALRLVAGIGEAMTLTAACIAAAAYANPERAFGAAQITAGAAAIIVLLAVPPLKLLFGLDASFLFLAAMALIAVPALMHLRRPVSISDDQRQRYPNPGAAAVILAAFALFSLADISTWLFADEIGRGAGMAAVQVEAVLSGTIGLALAGPALAMVLHVRLGRTLPMVIGLSVLAIAVVMFTRASSELIYVLAIIPLNFGFAFLTPYFLGALADLDEGGSWTSLSNSVLAIVGICGPLLAGHIAAHADYAGLAWLTGPAIVLALLLFVGSLKSPALRDHTVPTEAVRRL
ncbi:MFS transporter [Nostoc sp. CHAB 5844]|nr:MFS transporter [Nostoc sp. CHAB 5844]